MGSSRDSARHRAAGDEDEKTEGEGHEVHQAGGLEREAHPSSPLSPRKPGGPSGRQPGPGGALLHERAGGASATLDRRLRAGLAMVTDVRCHSRISHLSVSRLGWEGGPAIAPTQ